MAHTRSGDDWGATFSGYKWDTHLSASIKSPTRQGRERVIRTLSPQEHDILKDKYAPRAFADYTRDLSSSFPGVAYGGSYVGSPPRARDKFIGQWFAHGKAAPSPTTAAFLRGDPWESRGTHCTRSARAGLDKPLYCPLYLPCPLHL
jgi:hypothetical protein